MKIQSLKAFALCAFLFVLPFFSQARELPPEKIVDTPANLYLMMLAGIGALYGIFKMWNNNEPAK